MRAALAVNKELIQLYWHLDNDIIEKQKAYLWGDKFLEQFSQDMRHALPEMQGFSATTLKRMRLFAQEYPTFLFGAQAVHQLPWGHIVLLLRNTHGKAERDWFANQAVQHGWTRSLLEMKIKSNLFGQQGISSSKVTNFSEHLPTTRSELANEILKDPYHFDFLTISSSAHERAIEEALASCT